MQLKGNVQLIIVYLNNVMDDFFNNQTSIFIMHRMDWKHNILYLGDQCFDKEQNGAVLVAWGDKCCSGQRAIQPRAITASVYSLPSETIGHSTARFFNTETEGKLNSSPSYNYILN